MLISHPTLKVLRQIHLYLGIFTAPALLFFALTGALQTFSLHEASRTSDYKPPTWIVTLAQLHKKQTTTVPVRKPWPAPEAPKPDALKLARTPGAPSTATPNVAAPNAAAPSAPAPSAPAASAPRRTEPAQKSHLPMKIFFLTVALGLFLSTLTGILMAYKFNRNKVLVTGLLLAGILVPLLLLPF